MSEPIPEEYTPLLELLDEALLKREPMFSAHAVRDLSTGVLETLLDEGYAPELTGCTWDSPDHDNPCDRVALFGKDRCIPHLER